MSKIQPARVTHIARTEHVLRDVGEFTIDDLRIEVLRLRDELIGARAEIGNLRSRLEPRHREYDSMLALHRAERALAGPDAEYAHIARRILGFSRWALLRAPRKVARRVLAGVRSRR
jgi:hypothetical protein